MVVAPSGVAADHAGLLAVAGVVGAVECEVPQGSELGLHPLGRAARFRAGTACTYRVPPSTSRSHSDLPHRGRAAAGSSRCGGPHRARSRGRARSDWRPWAGCARSCGRRSGHGAGVCGLAAAVGAPEDLGRGAECRSGRHDSTVDRAVLFERRRRRILVEADDPRPRSRGSRAVYRLLTCSLTPRPDRGRAGEGNGETTLTPARPAHSTTPAPRTSHFPVPPPPSLRPQWCCCLPSRTPSASPLGSRRRSQRTRAVRTAQNAPRVVVGAPQPLPGTRGPGRHPTIITTNAS